MPFVFPIPRAVERRARTGIHFTHGDTSCGGLDLLIKPFLSRLQEVRQLHSGEYVGLRLAPPRTLALLSLALACSEPFTEVPADPVALPDLTCFPGSTSGGYGVQADWRAGWAIATGYAGGAAGFENVGGFAAIGAPASDAVGQSGMVMVRTIDFNGGQFSAGLWDTDVYAPTTTTARQFGRAVLTADVRECHGTGVPYAGCGHELFIANPDVWAHATPGEVHVYETYVPSPLDYLGVLSAPAGTPNGAEFGFAMAARRQHVDGATPWLQAPDVPPWVAIGAPGADRVVLYAVDPTSAWPLTYAQTLNGVDAGRRFGSALAVGDYNGDGLADLAVGAPKPYGGQIEGRVYVYPGLSAGPGPLAATPTVLNGFPLTGTSTGGVQQEEFGAALTAAHTLSDARDSLVVGAPRLDAAGDPDAGGVCSFRFNTCGTPGCAPVVAASRCDANPWATTSVTNGEQFGYSLSAANFFPIDGQERDDTPESFLEEVAVGRPGASGGADLANIFFTTSSLPYPSIGAQVPVGEFFAPAAGAGYATALAHIVTPQSVWADLVGGAPGSKIGAQRYGSYSLSQSLAPPTCSAGDYTFIDSQANLVTIRVSESGGDTVVTVVEEYHGVLVDSSGDPNACLPSIDLGPFGTIPATPVSTFTIPAGFEFHLSGAAACSGPTVFPAFDARPLLESILFAQIDDPALQGAVDGLLDAFVADNGTQAAVVTLDVDPTAVPTTLSFDLDLSGVSWSAIESLTSGSLHETCRPENLPWVGDFDGGVCDG